MPQIVNDESIIPSLLEAGLEKKDAFDYVLVGCVELSSQGNYLGWSDAAMFNLVKALELALNDGVCLLTGKQMGPQTGLLTDFNTYDELEEAFRRQIDHFFDKMMDACEWVEEAHQQYLPSPFLSSVVDECLEKGIDVTRGGARYNYSGIQAIQVANVADSLAVLKNLVYGRGRISRKEMLDALRKDFESHESLRYDCLNLAGKYGNDDPETDQLGAQWIEYFRQKLRDRKNFRGGPYQMGLYTVSAHMPMGENVGASPDGRKSGSPLADGGMSPMYGMDRHGPTAVLGSVARIPSLQAANGTLLNMKFLPSFFQTEQDRLKFSAFLRSFTRHPIHHIQFNVVSREDLLKARENPEMYKSLTVRVAGYTAFFTELSPEMQDEIIERTEYGGTV
jgi:formate C-acetyltransferase